jgi:hypothetical protein
MATQLPPNTTKTLYEQDFCLWIETTVKQLKEKQIDELDWEHLIEEIESLGKSDRRELRNRLTILLEHLLKLAYWEQERATCSRGWKDTIREQRRQINLLLKDSPSLKPFLLEIFAECYSDAREDSISKTGLSPNTFPTESPFTPEETLNPDYLLK